MGSKSALLRGALGDILLEELQSSRRFVDLFSGSGSVAHYVAENSQVPVLSVDLQHYAKALSAGIIERDHPFDSSLLIDTWLSSSIERTQNDEYRALLEPLSTTFGPDDVGLARERARGVSDELFVTRHYGGHYFAPSQALTLDMLYKELPATGPARAIALASLLNAASSCAASPGHTAQPFQPTVKLLPHIENAWAKNVIAECEKSLLQLSPRHAKVRGEANVADAMNAISNVESGDLVFCDPPYSAVQYSRFYHVLEGIARGGWPAVSGAGRAPDRSLRPSSAFSLKSQAKKAMQTMLDRLSDKKCRVLITFPDADASNGLSGRDIIAIASAKWRVGERYVDSTHSTLGGTKSEGGRGGRRQLQEAVLLLEPKNSKHERPATDVPVMDNRLRVSAKQPV